MKRHRLTLQKCIDLAISKNGQCLSTEYKNNYTKLIWQCSAGHMWKSDFHNIKDKDNWCPKCEDLSRKLSIDDCIKSAKLKNGKCLTIEYLNNRELMLWQCKAGHTWNASYSDIKQGHWCGQCHYISKKLTLDDCHIAAELNNGLFLSTKYFSTKDNYIWQCKRGHIFSARLDSVREGKWCIQCSKMISRAQEEIYNNLIAVFPNLDIMLNDTKTISPYHLDIHIPSLKLAIEYDGDFWHHSDWAINNGSLDRMYNKEQLCQGSGIALMHVKEADWLKNKEIELQKIIDFVQLSPIDCNNF